MTADLSVPLLLAFALLGAAALAAPLLARRRTLAGVVNLALVAAAAVLLFLVGYGSLFGPAGHASATLSLGPVTIPLVLDGLAGLFLGIVALIGLASALYSIRYLERFPGRSLRSYYACFPLFLLGMAGVLVVDDFGLGFTLAWQLMTVPAFFLVRFEREAKETVRAARNFLIFMELAWLLVVLGPLAVPGCRFGDALPVLAGKLGQAGGAPLALFFGLLLAGFGLKAGVFPLGQLWLPGAYSVAPSPVSALLSSAMSKTGVYGLIRAFLFMAPAGNPAFDARTWGLVVAAVGAATLLIGTIQAMKQSDAKRLLAYSSIGQIGYIVLAIGVALALALPAGPAVSVLAAAAVIGALYHALNHAIFKGMLFLTGGNILYATGTKDLNKLGGLIGLMPVTAAIAGLGSLAIAGMPATSGFGSKWLIIASSVLAGDSGFVLVVFGVIALFTSAVTLACYVKFFGMAFTSVGSEWNVGRPVQEAPASMLVPMIALTAICLVQGLFPALSVGLVRAALERSEGFLLAGALGSPAVPVPSRALGLGLPGLGGPVSSAAAAPLVVLLLVGLGLALGALLRRAGGSKEVSAPTWLCGYQDLSNANRYTDRGMFAGLRALFKFAGGKSGK
ncbi:MAG TPA: proton-conducting transporter membrane subunit [Candidatus Aminicenantes bacterium]|nr:proton-conducting transporter membrane subunit [Candidatus Aminicenantes bacterium]HRY63886.1 proton-conducting transporter membrane subunit [Candidatus Aminicenantes bacterium]HRZ70799.1 proton-conducting transporter membrane subunit [Candidatus Aminicenantes bacterium]